MGSRDSCYSANLSFTDEFISNMITILFKEGSDEFWKCLKYDSTDALTNSTYTISNADKARLIKQNTMDTRIKRLRFSDDISVEAHSEIRIFENGWEEISPRIFDVEIGFEIISHNDIITLDGTGYSRLNVFRNEILKLFRGRIVDGNIGELSTLGLSGRSGAFNNKFQGYKFSMMGGST